MSRVFDPRNQVIRYSSLGLIANPFFGVEITDDLATCCEVTSESNALLQAIVSAVREEKPRPIWVNKDTLIPTSYALAAESRIEADLGGDEGLNTLHASIPLFGMKNGAVRAVLRLLGERLVWRSFDKTLAAYAGQVLAEPDESLTSYSVMGPEALEAFAQAFAENPIDAVLAVMGELASERVANMEAVADMRQLNYVGDGAEDPAADGDEIDETVGNAPGLGIVSEQAEEEVAPDPFAGVADYIIDYASEHVSPVVGRALRVYRERGQAAAGNEFNITKAPRKTLTALVKFARARYEKVVLMWDGFDNWLAIDAELRSKITGLLSEMRWSLDGDAIMVFVIGEGQAPELEESFGSGTKLNWDFPGLIPIEETPDEIIPALIAQWFANAAQPGAAPLTPDDAGIAALIGAASGSMNRFVLLGRAAIEDAANRGATSIDETAVKTAIDVVGKDAAADEPEAE